MQTVAAVHPATHAAPPPMSPAEALEYIAGMLPELASFARRAGLRDLTMLLDTASLEADNLRAADSPARALAA